MASTISCLSAKVPVLHFQTATLNGTACSFDAFVDFFGIQFEHRCLVDNLPVGGIVHGSVCVHACASRHSFGFHIVSVRLGHQPGHSILAAFIGERTTAAIANLLCVGMK